MPPEASQVEPLFVDFCQWAELFQVAGVVMVFQYVWELDILLIRRRHKINPIVLYILK